MEMGMKTVSWTISSIMSGCPHTYGERQLQEDSMIIESNPKESQNDRVITIIEIHLNSIWKVKEFFVFLRI